VILILCLYLSLTFRIKFFLISIIFLIFDTEIILLIPSIILTLFHLIINYFNNYAIYIYSSS